MAVKLQKLPFFSLSPEFYDRGYYTLLSSPSP